MEILFEKFNEMREKTYRGKSPRSALAEIGGAINNSSIISSVSSSPLNDDDDFVGD